MIFRGVENGSMKLPKHVLNPEKRQTCRILRLLHSKQSNEKSCIIKYHIIDK